MIQSQKNVIVNTCTVCILENAKFQCKIQHFTFGKVCRMFRLVHEIRSFCTIL